MTQRLIYLAGPEVFLPDSAPVGERKKALCLTYGFIGLYPLDNELDPGTASARRDHAIFAANAEMIRRCDMGICNLTPFRGISADVGTVFELGMLAGLGKPVFGYTNDIDDFQVRTLRSEGQTPEQGEGVPRDRNGMLVEDFGNADNLMIDACLARQGHPVVRSRVDRRERFRDLRGFEACLVQARREAEMPGCRLA